MKKKNNEKSFPFRLFSEERDNYRTLYLKEHDRRLAAELRLKDTHNALA